MSLQVESEAHVVMTDLVASTAHVERLARGGDHGADPSEQVMRFFDGQMRTYEDLLMARLRPVGEGQAVRAVWSTGDGYAFLVADARRAIELAVELQEAADRHSDARRAEAEDKVDGHPEAYPFTTRIAVASGLAVSRVQYRAPGLEMREVTGPAAFRAARLNEKARAERAVLSPLVDGRTLALAGEQPPELRSCYLGQFAVDCKRDFEVPRNERQEDLGPSEVDVYTFLRSESPFAAAAACLDAALHRHYAKERGPAMEKMMELRRRLAEAETDDRPTERERWSEVTRHFTYVPLNFAALER